MTDDSIEPDSCFVYRERRFATWLDAAKARAADRLQAATGGGHDGMTAHLAERVIARVADDRLKLAKLIEALADLHRGEP